MPLTDLTPPPSPAPTRSMTNDEFIDAADATVAWWATFVSQMNTLTSELEVTAALIAAAPAYADPGLVALTGLTAAADRLPYFTGASTSALATFTAAARALLDDADATTMLSTLGLSANGKSLVTAADYAAMRTLLSVYSTSQVDSAVAAAQAAATTPSGAVLPFAMSTPPTGWLECNGSAVSRSTYAALFTAIGTTHGAGNGSTTFNLPDIRGEFVRGYDNGRGVDSGRTFGSAQSGAIESHTHSLKLGADNQIGHDASAEGDRTVDASGSATANYIASTGGSETRPRNIALMYCIKT